MFSKNEDILQADQLRKFAIQRTVRTSNDTLKKLDFEKNLLYSTIASKEREIDEIEFVLQHKLPNELENLEYLYQKELEIQEKQNLEHQYTFNNKDALLQQLKDMLKVYKETSHIDIEKTKENHLKIIFFRDCLKNNKDFLYECYVVVEIQEDKFYILKIFPEIKDLLALQNELNSTNNFTLFLTKIANEFLRIINYAK
jgi:hypothetical protein